MNTWDEATRVARDMETKARILGVQSQMKKFSFMFGVYLAEGQNVAGMVVRTLEKLRSSEAFDLFWQQSLTVQKPMVLENQICLVHAAQVRKELNEPGLKTDEEIKPELLEMLKSTRQGVSNLLPLLQPNPKATLGHAEPGHQAIPESAIKLNPIHSEVTLVRETPPLMEKRVEDGTREESPEPTRISTATPTTTITPREVTPPQNPSGIIGGLLTRFLANQSKPKPLPPKGEETNALMQAGGYAARERQRLLLQTARGLAALHIPECTHVTEEMREKWAKLEVLGGDKLITESKEYLKQGNLEEHGPRRRSKSLWIRGRGVKGKASSPKKTETAAKTRENPQPRRDPRGFNKGKGPRNPGKDRAK
eukprot:Em0090g9a